MILDLNLYTRLVEEKVKMTFQRNVKDRNIKLTKIVT